MYIRKRRFSFIIILIPDRIFFEPKATLTKAINAGTSTNGPITPANAWPLLILNTPMATAMASSKLLPAAVKAIDTLVE